MGRFESESSMHSAGGQLCARARFWVSLRVDGELSELEGALLDAHLARCAECAAFAAGTSASTTWLRGAELERPAPITVAVPRAPRRAAVALVAAAALMATGLVAGFVHGTGSTAGRQTALRPAVSVVSSMETPDELRRLRRTSLLNQRPMPREYSVEPA
jgi:predicted anti-sigma-YlaC factor YlaD